MSKKKKGNLMRTPSFRKTIVPRRKMKLHKRRKSRIQNLNNSFLIQEFSYGVQDNHSNSTNILKMCKKLNIGVMNQNDKLLKARSIQGKCKKSDAEFLNSTIELSADESSIQCIQESKKAPEKVFIDLCKDATDQNEVIIITENPKHPSISEKSETTIIDISDDDREEKNSSMMTDQINDDILVIEPSNKIPLSNSTSCKINNIVQWCVNEKKIKNKKNLHFKPNKGYKKNHNCPPQRYYQNQRYYQQPSVGSIIGENVYLNSDLDLPEHGLRPIIIDGSNVAIINKRGRHFSCKRLEICIKYFKERGHKVTAFVPQFRTLNNKSDNPELLRKMVQDGDVILTPSKQVEGVNIVPYDDRFIVQTAVLKGGIIVTRDNYKDLLEENPAWAETINYRTLPYTWVDDVLMFPKDPLGDQGPSLEEFLKFH